jgi:hypothetical protein
MEFPKGQQDSVQDGMEFGQVQDQAENFSHEILSISGKNSQNVHFSLFFKGSIFPREYSTK